MAAENFLDLKTLETRWQTCSRAALEADGKILADGVARFRTQAAQKDVTEALEIARTIWRARFGKATAQPVAKVQDVIPATAAESAGIGEAQESAQNLLTGLTFTVEFAGGEYVTLRVVQPETGQLAGKRILQFLAGPDNETNFAGLGFVSDSGQVSVWGRFKSAAALPNSKISRYLEAYQIARKGDQGKYTEAYATISGRCSHCHRKLTVPASLRRGLGPDCAEKLGV